MPVVLMAILPPVLALVCWFGARAGNDLHSILMEFPTGTILATALSLARGFWQAYGCFWLLVAFYFSHCRPYSHSFLELEVLCRAHHPP